MPHAYATPDPSHVEWLSAPPIAQARLWLIRSGDRTSMLQAQATVLAAAPPGEPDPHVIDGRLGVWSRQHAALRTALPAAQRLDAAAPLASDDYDTTGFNRRLADSVRRELAAPGATALILVTDAQCLDLSSWAALREITIEAANAGVSIVALTCDAGDAHPAYLDIALDACHSTGTEPWEQPTPAAAAPLPDGGVPDSIIAAAVCGGGVPVRWLEQLQSERAEAILAECQQWLDAALVSTDGRSLVLGSAGVREAVLTRAGSEHLHGLAERLAEVSADVEIDFAIGAHAFGHLMDIIGETEFAVRRLLTAAENYEAGGRPWEAVHAFGMAAAIDPTRRRRFSTIERRGILAMALAPSIAAAYWMELAQQAQEADDTNIYAKAIYHLHRCAPSERTVSLLDDVARIDDAGMPWVTWARACLTVRQGRYDEGAIHARQTLRESRRAGDRTLEASALEVLSFCLAFTGALADAARYLRQAISCTERRRNFTRAAQQRFNLADIMCEQLQLETAESELDRLERLIEDAHLDDWTAVVEAKRLSVRATRGDLIEPLRRSRSALGHDAERHFGRLPADLRSLTLGMHLQLAVSAGDLALADRALDLLRTLSNSDVDTLRSLDAEVEIALVVRAVMRGEGDVAQRLAAFDLDEPETLARMALPVYRLAALQGDDATASAAQHLLMDHDGSIDTPFVATARQELAAWSSDTAGALDAQAAIWDRAGMHADAAACRALAGLRMHADGRWADGRRALVEAYGALSAAGAGAYAGAVEQAVISRYGEQQLGDELAGLNVLAQLTPAQVLEVRRVMRISRLEPGDQLDPGQRRGESLYVLLSGHVRRQIQHEGRRLSTGLLDVGDIVLLAAGDSTEQFDALSAASFGCLPASELSRLSKTIPQLALNIVELVRRQAEATAHLAEGFAYSTVLRRLCQLALRLARQMGTPTLDGHVQVSHAFTQQELAEMVGATRKSVVASLAELRRTGALELRARRLVLLDVDTLTSIADGEDASKAA